MSDKYRDMMKPYKDLSRDELMNVVRDLLDSLALTEILMNQPKVVTQHTQQLWDYSQSYEFPTPFTYFTDIIGWSEAHYGGRIADPAPTIGYLEARLIGTALIEYADDPEAVVGFINEVLFGNQLELPLDTGRGD